MLTVCIFFIKINTEMSAIVFQMPLMINAEPSNE